MGADFGPFQARLAILETDTETRAEHLREAAGHLFDALKDHDLSPADIGVITMGVLAEMLPCLDMTDAQRATFLRDTLALLDPNDFEPSSEPEITS